MDNQALLLALSTALGQMTQALINKDAKNALKLEGQSLAQIIQTVTGGSELTLQGLEDAVNAFIANKATAVEVVAGTDDEKYVTSVGVKAAIDALIDGAPEALNTLKKLADKLADQDDAVAALLTAIDDKLGATEQAVDSAKLDGKTRAEIIAEAQAGVDLSQVVLKTDDFGQYNVGDDTLADLLSLLAADADLQALQTAFNAFVAAKATEAEVIAGTDNTKYTTALSVKAAIDAAVAELVGSAPEALNTINELAAALNNDPDIINQLMIQIGNKWGEAEVQAEISSTLAASGINAPLDMRVGAAGEVYATMLPDAVNKIGILRGLVRGNQIGLDGAAGLGFGVLTITGQVPDADLPTRITAVHREFRVQHAGAYHTWWQAGVHDGTNYSWGVWKRLLNADDTAAKSFNMVVNVASADVASIASSSPSVVLTALSPLVEGEPSHTMQWAYAGASSTGVGESEVRKLVIPGIEELYPAVTAGEYGILEVSCAPVSYNQGSVPKIIRTFTIGNLIFTQHAIGAATEFTPWERVGSTADQADDSARLGGELPAFYASATDLAAAIAAIRGGAASEETLKTLRDALDAFIANKATVQDVLDGTDDSKYVTALGLKAGVDAAIDALVNGAPEALDTLKELADALADQNDAVAGVVSVLSTKLDEAQVQALITAALADFDQTVTDTYATKSEVEELMVAIIEAFDDSTDIILDIERWKTSLTVGAVGDDIGFITGSIGSATPVIFNGTDEIVRLSWSSAGGMVLEIEGDYSELTFYPVVVDGFSGTANGSASFAGGVTTVTFAIPDIGNYPAEGVVRAIVRHSPLA